MVAVSVPNKPGSRRRWKYVRVSVRGLALLTLMISVGLGWAVRSARVQRDAIAAIDKARGEVYYDWEIVGGSIESNARPWWPKWLDDLVGADYFGHVVEVRLPEGASDSELGHVGNLSRLEMLWLCNEGPEYDERALTDTGLVNLERLSYLRELELEGASITDASLTHVKKLTRLKRLSLRNTLITDAGLVHIMDLPRLQNLDLSHTAVTDAGLAHLKDMTNLRDLNLSETAVTDAGLAHLKGMTFLDLDLRSTAVTDVGIADLMGVAKPRALWVGDTRVTDSKMRGLRKSFPKTQIER
jgi:internalin A